MKQFGQGSNNGFPALCPLERMKIAFSGVCSLSFSVLLAQFFGVRESLWRFVFSELYVRTLKFVMAWDLKIDAAPKIFQKKTKKKTEKKRKKESLLVRGRGIVSRFFAKSFCIYFRCKNLFAKTRRA